ncbi:MAG: hypothetical protein AMXMBFR84_17950 [Candidatus Hydrogenedentota bacterium]
MGLITWYWNGILNIPVNILLRFGLPASDIVVFITKLVLTLILLYILKSVLSKVWDIVSNLMNRNRLADGRDIRALGASGGGAPAGQDFVQNLEAAQNLEGTVKRLKGERNYLGVAKAYASVNRHKDAAKWYKKAGQKRESARELALAGYTAKAAKLLLKEGDFETAGRLFGECGKHFESAKAYAQAGRKALSASAYRKAAKYREAAEVYLDYFSNPTDAVEEQVVAAEECFAMLANDAAKEKVPADVLKQLQPHLAQRFEKSKKFDLAAALFKEAGDLVRAGEVFVLAGKLEEAAECMKAAGKTKEASRIVGRYHEMKSQWKEAAMAFVQSGDILKAGECFSKAADPLRAAECFEKAGDFARAGLAYAQATRYEAGIKVLQKIPETDSTFDTSRALLGRCFWETHDYEHCAATLENHLTNKRVETNNIEYWYMLALAYEQLGKLDKSKEILLKIGAVNRSFRDVSQRLSSVASRISMQAQLSGQMTAGPSGSISGGGPQPASADPGTQLMTTVQTSLGGRYVLDKELGRGGMGVVYMARDTQLDRPVALKFIGNLVDNSDEFRQRFIREARTAAKISHPNIIAIYDISASVGKAYIAMEFIEGPNLQKHLSMRKAGLPPREAINIIGQACNALAAIHDAGIVHRDIKPENILLAKGGLVKLTDFGLAKAEDSRMTQQGVIMGTPSFMAPEQVLGKDADARSDIYSLGLVFWECLTGETAISGNNVLERQLKELPPKPSEKNPIVTPDIDTVVMKCIAKKREDRYTNCKDLMAELRKLNVK